MKVKHPAAPINWRPVESSNVSAVGWDRAHGMYVRFQTGDVYRYANVSRQRAVACARSSSVGRYLNCTKIGGQA